MFNSIRWKFILIYFLLVFLVMSVVGFVITDQLERIQLQSVTKSMNSHISSIIASSTYLQSGNWDENIENIRDSVERSVEIGYNENLFIILNNDEKTIIASSVPSVIDLSSYETGRIDNQLILSAPEEGITEKIPEIGYDGTYNRIKHMAYTVNNEYGETEGIIYLTYTLESVDEIISETRQVFTRTTLLALLVTVVLGFFIATSITGPIKDVTEKAREMSKGNFRQKVDVKSDDEIGQLGMMFNYLTEELEQKISQVYQEKNKMETIFNNMTDGVITFDLEGNIIYANPEAIKILSIESGKNVHASEILNDLDFDLRYENLRRNNYSGSIIINIDDNIYNINYAPYSSSEEKTEGIVFVLQDITEQQKLENMRSEFVANVSHELKTPITTVKSYTETLLDGAYEDKEIMKEFLEVINSESDRMTRIVSDLLDLSRMEYNQAMWNRIELEPDNVVRETVKKLAIKAKEKEQELVCTIEDFTGKVIFDRDALEKVFQNIIGNAIKYTPEKGKVVISSEIGEDAVIYHITDTGIGIPEKDKKRIFERFYRVDKARSRKMGGTGLGLAIVKHILEAHHSEIKINSTLGKGTEVIISIPFLKGKVI